MSIWLIYLFSMNAMLFGWIAAPRPGLGEGHGEYSASLLENFQSSKEASSKQAKQGLFRIQQRADVLAVLAALASQQKSSQLFWMPWKPGRSLDEAWTKPRGCVLSTEAKTPAGWFARRTAGCRTASRPQAAWWRQWRIPFRRNAQHIPRESKKLSLQLTGI